MPSLFRRMLFLSLLLAPAVGAAPVNEEMLAGDPEFRHLPARAVDTDAIPAMQLDPNAADEAPLPLYRLAADTYFLYGNIATLNPRNRGWMGNAGFIVTDEGVVVIDALGTPKLGRRFLATIRRVTDRPIRYLIITHNHPDHAYGAIAFKRAGAKVIAHRGALQYLGSAQMEASVAYRRQLLGTDMDGFEPVHPDILVGPPRFGHITLKLGGKQFEIYNVGQHHSHGDLVVYQVEPRIVWISDLAFNHRVTFMGDGHSQQALEAEAWLMKKFADAALMVPGHGSAQSPPFPMVPHTHEYIEKLRRLMKQDVEAGVPLLEAINNADFPAWRGERLYGENHKANAQFVYQEMEQALFDE